VALTEFKIHKYVLASGLTPIWINPKVFQRQNIILTQPQGHRKCLDDPDTRDASLIRVDQQSFYSVKHASLSHPKINFL
jgi:hypothetical protein